MIVEQHTNYAYKLKYMGNPTFDKVRDLSTKFYRELPQALQDELFETLNRGVDILDSEPQMTTYLYAFGKMHQAKLNYAFGKLPKEFLEQPEINIIDYGCGQALGTKCYADYLRENGYSQKAKTITLIEPSEICLKRAALHASVFFPDANIITVHKSFDDLDETDIYCDKDIPTLHILSNVLDILDFNIKDLTELLKAQINGFNQFICVGPYFNNPEKDNRIYDFFSQMDGKEDYYGTFDKYEFVEQKAWTAIILCFSVRKEQTNISPTKITKAEIIKGIEDEYGVVYSKNGEKLLKCKNSRLKTYTIKHGTKIICDNVFENIWGLQNIVIPDTVTMIGKQSFYGCDGLQNIAIPNSVTTIGDNAFENCGSLRQINLPDSVTTIGNRIFVFCESLQQVIIPNSVMTIGTNPFIDCKIVELKSDSSRFVVKKGLLINNQDTIISYVGNDERVIIPNNISTIGDYAFCKCKFTQQIDIPNSVTMISQGAFASSSIQRITIPDTIILIEDYVFGFCDLLQQITIPQSVTRIGDTAFYCCKSLQQINIPEFVTEIGDGAFYGCESLQLINLPNAVRMIGRNAFWGCKSLQQITIPIGSKEKFKKMLDKELWDKLVEQ